jgi:hypothetical protein
MFSVTQTDSLPSCSPLAEVQSYFASTELNRGELALRRFYHLHTKLCHLQFESSTAAIVPKPASGQDLSNFHSTPIPITNFSKFCFYDILTFSYRSFKWPLSK